VPASPVSRCGKAKRVPAAITVTDLVKRDFRRDGPNQLWVTDITEHPTREGKLYCCVVLDTYSRRVVGWAIDSRQRADLATSALGMPIDSRSIAGQVPGGIIHGDHGTQFTSWTFTERARRAGLLPSLGSVGDPYDNAVAEAFWGRMQTELLDRPLAHPRRARERDLRVHRGVLQPPSPTLLAGLDEPRRVRNH
jgi:putative transposase